MNILTNGKHIVYERPHPVDHTEIHVLRTVHGYTVNLKYLETHETQDSLLPTFSCKEKAIKAADDSSPHFGDSIGVHCDLAPDTHQTSPTEIDYSSIKAGREDFHDRKKNRIDGYKNLSEKASQKSNDCHETSRSISQHIPFGQPILVGHHSEKRARKDQERLHNLADKSVLETKKSEYYSQKASSAESNTSISSDNPDSLIKLKEKLDTLIKKQTHMKAMNLAWRKFKKNPASLDSSNLSESNKIFVRNYQTQYSFDTGPFPSYSLTNNNAKIKNTKKRLNLLVSRANDSTQTLFDENDIQVIDNVEENRLQIFFPDKPEQSVRTDLKSKGFKWSRTSGAWQRFRSLRANRLALQVVLMTL